MSRTTILTEWPHALNRYDCAMILGCVQSTVTVWSKQGMPVLEDGRYDLAAVIKWRVSKAISDAKRGNVDDKKTEAEIAKLNRENEKRDIELAKLKGENIKRSEHETMMAGFARQFVNTVNQETSEFSTKVVGISSIDIAFTRMNELARNIFTRILGKSDGENKKI
jgi:phage terminase Nu1 subunit (DNA packaging protein)